MLRILISSFCSVLWETNFPLLPTLPLSTPLPKKLYKNNCSQAHSMNGSKNQSIKNFHRIYEKTRKLPRTAACNLPIINPSSNPTPESSATTTAPSTSQSAPSNARGHLQ